MKGLHTGYLNDKMREENFLIAKKYEFAWLKWMEENDIIYHMEPTKAQFDSYDAVGEVYCKFSLIELKIREVKSTTYPTSYIELSKFGKIFKEIRQIQDGKVTGKLFSIYPLDNSILQFDLLRSPHIIDRGVFANAVTMSGGDKKKKDMVGYLINQCEHRWSIPKDLVIEDYFPTKEEMIEFFK